MKDLLRKSFINCPFSRSLSESEEKEMPEAVHEYEARCSICGNVFTAPTKEQAVHELEQHAQQAHGKTITEQQAEKMIHKVAKRAA